MTHEQVIQMIEQLSDDEQKKVADWLEKRKPVTAEQVSDESELEQKFLARLLEKGLISEIPPRWDDDDDDFEPIEVEGEPLSEMIIRERR